MRKHLTLRGKMLLGLLLIVAVVVLLLVTSGAGKPGPASASPSRAATQADPTTCVVPIGAVGGIGLACLVGVVFWRKLARERPAPVGADRITT